MQLRQADQTLSVDLADARTPEAWAQAWRLGTGIKAPISGVQYWPF